MPDALSPYQAVLGRELAGLHPRLRAYFAALAEGQRGEGSGSWDRVGTRRRWLWPVLSILARDGIAFPLWEADIPFDIVNRPGGTPTAPTVEAVRIFHASRHDLVMVDSVTVRDGTLVDRLGASRRLVALFEARVENGDLLLTSTAVRVRIGRRTLAVPRPLRPRVQLRERYDDEVGRQHVEVVLTAPLVGRLYEYSGHFDYRIVDTEEDHD